MVPNCIIHVSFREKIAIWVKAIYFSFIIYIRNFIFSLWKTPNANISQYRPLPIPFNEGVENHMYIKINGVKFHYVESGKHNQSTVILLHGFADCWLGWRHQMKALSRSFRVIAIDLKGFGDSEKPQWRHRYNVRVLIEELSEFIESIGAKPCHLVGHDIGALLGWFLVAQHPYLVRKFVPIACPHPNVFWDHIPNTGAFNSRFFQLCSVPFMPESLFRRDNLAMIDHLYDHLHKSKEESLIETYKYVFSRQEDVAGPMHYLRNLMLTRLTNEKITVPVLLLAGTRDPYAEIEDFIRSTTFLDDFEIKVVENAKHFPHQEEYLQVNDLLLSYLRDIPEQDYEIKTENQKGIIGSLVSSTFRYGNSLVDNVKKTTNGVVWRPQLLKSTG